MSLAPSAVSLSSKVDAEYGPPVPSTSNAPDPGDLRSLQRWAGSQPEIGPPAPLPASADDLRAAYEAFQAPPPSPPTGNEPTDFRTLSMLPPSETEPEAPSVSSAPLSSPMQSALALLSAIGGGVPDAESKIQDYATQAGRWGGEHGTFGAGAVGVGGGAGTGAQTHGNPTTGTILGMAVGAAPMAALYTAAPEIGLPTAALDAYFAAKGGQGAIQTWQDYQAGKIDAKTALTQAIPDIINIVPAAIHVAPAARAALSGREEGSLTMWPGGEPVKPGAQPPGEPQPQPPAPAEPVAPVVPPQEPAGVLPATEPPIVSPPPDIAASAPPASAEPLPAEVPAPAVEPPPGAVLPPSEAIAPGADSAVAEVPAGAPSGDPIRDDLQRQIAQLQHVIGTNLFKGQPELLAEAKSLIGDAQAELDRLTASPATPGAAEPPADELALAPRLKAPSIELQNAMTEAAPAVRELGGAAPPPQPPPVGLQGGFDAMPGPESTWEPWVKRVGETIANLANLPRTLLTIVPGHGVFRAGAVEVWRHPSLTLKDAGINQIKALGSESTVRALDDAINTHPDMTRPQSALHGAIGIDAGPPGLLTIAKEGEIPNVFDPKGFTSGDNDVMATLGDKLRIPFTDIKPIESAKRSYQMFVKSLRTGVYSSEAWEAYNDGARDVSTYRNIWENVLHRTGYGGIAGPDLGAGNVLKFNPFFSWQRTMASFRYPADVLNMDKYARSAAFKALAAQTVGMTSALATASYFIPGATTALNPWNADFGRLRVGGMTYDFTGGEASLVRLMAQMIYGRRDTVGTTGPETVSAGRWGLLKNWLVSKENPALGLGSDAFSGKTVDWTKPSDVRTELYDKLTPIVIHDMIEAARTQQIRGLLTVTGPAILGTGVGTTPSTTRELFAARTQAAQAHGFKDLNDAIATAGTAGRPAIGAIENDAGVNAARQAYQDAQKGPVADIRTRQQAIDDQFTSGKITAAQWRDAHHGLVREQQGASAGGPTTSVGIPAVDGYRAVLADPKYQDDKAGLTAALDDYRANLQPAERRQLDNFEALNASGTDTVRQYHDAVQKLADAGWFDASKTLMAKLHMPQYASVADLQNDLTNRIVARLAPAQQTPEIRQLIANKIGMSPGLAQLASIAAKLKLAALATHPDAAPGAVRFGFAKNDKDIALALLGQRQAQTAGVAQ